MSITVEISNTKNLRRLKDIFGTTDDSEAVERSIEMTIRDSESDIQVARGHDLPEEFWEELFSMPLIPSSVIDEALRIERE